MNKDNIEILKNGGVGVIPTDTIYGLVGRADLPATVEKISKIKNQLDRNGFIVLIGSIEDLKGFGVEISDTVRNFLEKYWPGKVSVAFSFTGAFRLPDNESLRKVLQETGPLIAPSANPPGLPPAKNIAAAREYFGEQVDFYEDGGNLDSLPSTLVKLKDDKIEVLREGAVKIK